MKCTINGCGGWRVILDPEGLRYPTGAYALSAFRRCPTCSPGLSEGDRLDCAREMSAALLAAASEPQTPAQTSVVVPPLAPTPPAVRAPTAVTAPVQSVAGWVRFIEVDDPHNDKGGTHV